MSFDSSELLLPVQNLLRVDGGQHGLSFLLVPTLIQTKPFCTH